MLPSLFEKQFIFQSKSLSSAYKFEFTGDFSEYFITLSDGIKLNALLFKTRLPRRGLILYTHGNADNLKRWGKYRDDFLSRGYDILMYDYREYGKSEGIADDDLLRADGLEVYDWLKNKYSDEEFILYGRSLGAAIATHTAQHRSAKMLLLETPFDQIKSIIKSRFPFLIRLFPRKYQFDNISPLKQGYTFPVHIFHGTKDRVVPLTCALNLKPFLKPTDSFTIIDKAGHKNLSKFSAFQKALDKYLGEKL